MPRALWRGTDCHISSHNIHVFQGDRPDPGVSVIGVSADKLAVFPIAGRSTQRLLNFGVIAAKSDAGSCRILVERSSAIQQKSIRII